MKIKSGFILYSMGKDHVVVAVEERTKEFNGMIRLNATGAFLWNHMQEDFTEESLMKALMAEYGVTEETAKEAVTGFMESFRGADVFEN